MGNKNESIRIKRNCSHLLLEAASLATIQRLYKRDYQLKSLVPFPAAFNFSGFRVSVGGGRGGGLRGDASAAVATPLIPLNIKLNLRQENAIALPNRRSEDDRSASVIQFNTSSGAYSV